MGIDKVQRRARQTARWITRQGTNLWSGFWALDSSARWVATSGFLAAAAASVYAVVATFQWCAMRDTLELSREQGRPWIVLDQLVFSNPDRSSTTASIRNAGGGPAFNVAFAYECGLASRTADDSLFREAADCIERARSRTLWWASIGAGNLRASFTVGKNNDPDDVRLGDEMITCFGAITYEAADGSAHETRFAMQYNKLAHDLRIHQETPMQSGASWISSGFDASDFKAVGGARLNWAN